MFDMLEGKTVGTQMISTWDTFPAPRGTRVEQAAWSSWFFIQKANQKR